MHRAWPLTALALGVVVGCASGAVFDVPVPALATIAPRPPMEQAIIALQVVIPLASLQTRLDSVFPRSDSLGETDCALLGGLICHQYVYRVDSMQLAMHGSRFALTTALRYRGRVALPLGGLASCGYDPDPMRHAEFRMSTELYWTTRWRLASRATSLAASLPDPCLVTVMRIDATPLMRRVIDGQLARLTRDVDSIIPAATDLRATADSLWRVMQTPAPLDSTGTVWLVVAPEAIALTPVNGIGANESASVGSTVVLRARPRIVVGERPRTDMLPLPALTLAAPATGLHIPVEIDVPFSTLSARVTALMAGEIAGENLRVREVRIWGVGDTAVVALNLEGKMRGALYLVGRIAYDTAARVLRVDDLRYTLASASTMSRMKATIGAPLIRRAIRDATSGGVLALGAQLDSLASRLTQSLNSELAPGATAQGVISSVRIVGLFTGQTSFILRVVLDGEARVTIR